MLKLYFNARIDHFNVELEWQMNNKSVFKIITNVHVFPFQSIYLRIAVVSKTKIKFSRLKKHTNFPFETNKMSIK